jgi:ABC-type glycerol-3-phosphate transport system permease component
MDSVTQSDRPPVAPHYEDIQEVAITRRGEWGPKLRKWLRKLVTWIPLALLVLWTVAPLLVTLSVSFKTRGEVFAFPSLIPEEPTLDPYREVLARPGFRGAFVNSIVVGVGTAFLTLALSVPAAYSFARFNFRGRHLLLLLVLLPRLIPSVGLMVPLYRIAILLGVLDQRLTLIVAFAGTLVPLAVWLLVGFFQAIPRDLEEAANVDGASTWTRLRFIVMPLAFPALLTIGVLAFREAWNEFGLVLALTRTPGNRTLPYELFLMQDGTGLANYPGEAAFALLTLVPFLLVYLRIERFVVSGITSGAIK